MSFPLRTLARTHKKNCQSPNVTVKCHKIDQIKPKLIEPMKRQ